MLRIGTPISHLVKKNFNDVELVEIDDPPQQYITIIEFMVKNSFVNNELQKKLQPYYKNTSPSR